MNAETILQLKVVPEGKEAWLNVPMTIESIHFNVFVLIRRGYNVEEITLVRLD